MPGVLIVEAMAQAGAALLFTEVTERDNKLLVFTGIERARFRRPVTPGDSSASRSRCSPSARRPDACKAKPMSTASSPARPWSPAAY